MKANKLNETIKNIVQQLDRSQLEVFLISILKHKLTQFTQRSVSTEELRKLMLSLPHFEDAEKFMMLNTYEQFQIFKTYKQVFLSLISESSAYTVSELKETINSYLQLSTESDLIQYNTLFDVPKSVAA